MLGTGAISQQFSTPEFVEMALFSAEFMRHAGEHLKILGNLFILFYLHLKRQKVLPYYLI